jgi:hypothetical protein
MPPEDCDLFSSDRNLAKWDYNFITSNFNLVVRFPLGIHLGRRGQPMTSGPPCAYVFGIATEFTITPINPSFDHIFFSGMEVYKGGSKMFSLQR